jgi:hypothetical protein
MEEEIQVEMLATIDITKGLKLNRELFKLKKIHKFSNSITAI